MQETPLIYTTKGNLPVADLERKDGWDFTASGISYWEEYYLGAEVVKRNVAVFQLPIGTKLQLTQGVVG
jgi:hypothetical protein